MSERDSLPPGWAWATLGQVTEPVEQRGPGNSETFLYIDIGAIDNCAKQISEARRIPVSEAPSRARQNVRTGDVLVSMTRPNLNAVALVPPSLDGAVASTGFYVLRARHVEPRWLFAAVRSPAFVRAMTDLVQGALYPAVRPADILGYRIPIPPLAEQRRIVAKLDELLASSRTAAAALDAVPSLLDQYRKAVLAAAFRGELACSDTKRDGTVPVGWHYLTIAELAADVPRAIQSGPFGSSLKHSEFQDTGALAVGIDNVHQAGFRMGRQNRVSESKFQELAKYAARPGDVLITVMATVGRCCVMPHDVGPAIITKHVYRITVDRSRVVPEYLMYALQGSHDIQDQIGASIRGQTRPGINGEILRALRVPVAPLEEQNALVERVRTALAALGRLESTVEQQRERLGHLEHAVLAKTLRGELVHQDSTDESAAALLDCLRPGQTTVSVKRRRPSKSSRV